MGSSVSFRFLSSPSHHLSTSPLPEALKLPPCQRLIATRAPPSTGLSRRHHHVLFWKHSSEMPPIPQFRPFTLGNSLPTQPHAVRHAYTLAYDSRSPSPLLDRGRCRDALEPTIDSMTPQCGYAPFHVFLDWFLSCFYDSRRLSALHPSIRLSREPLADSSLMMMTTIHARTRHDLPSPSSPSPPPSPRRSTSVGYMDVRMGSLSQVGHDTDRSRAVQFASPRRLVAL